MSNDSSLVVASQIHTALSSSLGQLTPSAVNSLEREMLQHEQVDCPVIHRFAPGIYMRELNMKAGTLAIGHYQKTTHLNLFMKGKVVIFNEDGSKTELAAPMFFVSEPGRKVGYVLEDMVWINIYSTDETNIEKLESMFLEKSAEFQSSTNQFHDMESSSEDRDDFFLAIKELGYTPEIVRFQSENLLDQIEMPFGSYKIQTAQSKIEGTGLFATSNIEAGEVIAPALIDFKRTPVGRFANHSKNPNAEIRVCGFGSANLIATKSINGCKGGQLGEEITVDYRQVVRENQIFLEE